MINIRKTYSTFEAVILQNTLAPSATFFGKILSEGASFFSAQPSVFHNV
jgi:hypothetical protein